MRKSTKLMAGLGVVAGLAVAAAPLAVNATDLGVDTLVVTVSSSCSLETGLDDPSTSETTETNAPFANRYKDTVNAGSYVILNEQDLVTAQDQTISNGQKTSLSVKCNDAYPSGTTISDATTGHGWSLKGAGTALAGATSGTSIPNSDPDDGAHSGWGVKLTKSDTGNTTVVDDYTDYKSLPTTATVIAYGSTAGANASVTIDSYKVSAAPEQAADTYTGTATYTFVAPQS